MLKTKYNNIKPIKTISPSLLHSLQLLLYFLFLLSLLLEKQRQNVEAAAFIPSSSQPTTIAASRTAPIVIPAPYCYHNGISRFSIHQRPNCFLSNLSTRLHSSSSSSSSSYRNKDDNEDNQPPPPTLYEILNSSPSATRSELKKAYVELVRQLHPDALGSKSTSQSEMQFQQITQAWKTLSNPLERKRYDRDLRAQKFTKDVEQALGNWANTAGPQFLRAFENVAIPFLRRSAATTVAGWNAVAQDVQMYSMNRKARERQQQQQQQQQQESSSSSSSSPPPMMGLGAILSNALVATQKAGKAIDRLELIEKSRELSKRAQKEMRDAAKLREELDEIARKRVQLTLHTPKSNLTSLEAMIILDGFNTVDEVTMMDTVLMRRKTVTFEIERLEEIENQVKEKRDRNQEIACKIQEQKSSLEQAKINESVALTAVENARKALQDAMDLAQSARDSIIVMENNLQSYEEEQRINTMDMDKLNDAMMKQQERMRLALRRKEEAMATENNKARHDVQLDNHNNNNINNNIRGDFKDDIAEYAQAQVEKMLKQESFLRAESARLQAQAERLESRSVKLLERANELEEEEERAYKALEEGIRVAKQAADGGYGKYGERK